MARPRQFQQEPVIDTCWRRGHDAAAAQDRVKEPVRQNFGILEKGMQQAILRGRQTGELRASNDAATMAAFVPGSYVFCIGTTEGMVAGLLPMLSRDLSCARRAPSWRRAACCLLRD